MTGRIMLFDCFELNLNVMSVMFLLFFDLLTYACKTVIIEATHFIYDTAVTS